MKRREAKSPAGDEQLALPFDRSPKGNPKQRRRAARRPDSRCSADDRDRPVKTLQVDCLRRPGNDQDRQMHISDDRCAQSPSGQCKGHQP